MEYLTDYDLRNLSEKIKPLTWVIKVTHGSNNKAVETYGTGFAIKVGDSMKNGNTVLMTCAHIVKNIKGKCSITVRNLHDNDFILEAEILDLKPTWDIALLVVKGVSHDIYAEFADDGSISNCQTLLHVGHSNDFVWSVFVGRAVYQCVNDFVPFSPRDICGTYVCSSLKTTPKYRIMGHIWNQAYFNKYKSLKFPFEKNLSPHIPIIQCAGFSCRDGCSGGPVFNSQGHIVGMIVGEVDGSQIAIHLSLLKEFVRMNSTTTQDSSEDALRQLKRKNP